MSSWRKRCPTMQVPDFESTNQNRARSRRPRDLEYETLVVWQKRAIHCEGEKRKRDGEREREGKRKRRDLQKDFPMAAMVCCSAVLPLSIRIKSCDVEGRAVVGWQQMRTSCTFARRNLAFRRRAGGNTGVEPDLQEDDYDVNATAGSELRVGLLSPPHKFKVFFIFYFSFPVWKFCLLS